jgi:hypothetical protein
MHILVILSHRVTYGGRRRWVIHKFISRRTFPLRAHATHDRINQHVRPRSGSPSPSTWFSTSSETVIPQVRRPLCTEHYQFITNTHRSLAGNEHYILLYSKCTPWPHHWKISTNVNVDVCVHRWATSQTSFDRVYIPMDELDASPQRKVSRYVFTSANLCDP